MSTKKDHEIDEVLAKLAEDIAALLKTRDKIEPGIRYIPVPPEKVSTSKLPTTGPKSGQLQEAEKWFREAEEMQKKSQPGYPYLYSWVSGSVGH